MSVTRAKSIVTRMLIDKSIGHIYLLFIICAGAVIYANSMNVPFYFDDYVCILDNSAIHFKKISLDGIRNILSDSALNTRPVANISFALNYYFSQNSPQVYHYVNVLIHIMTGIILFKFLEITLRSPVMQGTRNAAWLAFWSALLWYVHPVQTQAITYIVQRMTSMASMFYVLSLCCYANGRLPGTSRRKVLWFAGCCGSGLLALGSKEIAVTLPVFILLYEWFFHQDCSRSYLKKIIPYLAVAGVGLFLVVLLNLPFIAGIFAGYEMRYFSLVERLLTEPRVVLYYISLLFFPYPGRLSLEHDFPVSHSIVEPVSTLFSILLLTAIFLGACAAARKHRLFSFAVFWFLGNLLLESTVLPLEILFEHRLYLPSMLFFIFIPFLFSRFSPNKYLANGALIFVFLILSFLTVQRNNVWANPLLFHQNNIKNAPNNFRSYYNLGYYHLRNGRPGETIEYLQKALSLEPMYLRGYKDLGFAYIKTGQYESALQQFIKIVPYFPNDPEVYYYLGIISRERGERDKAIMYFKDVLKFAPKHQSAHENLGSLFVVNRQYDQAIPHFQELLQITGENNFSIQVNLGNCYAHLGKYEKALEHYSIALQIEPDHEKLIMNMQLAQQRMKSAGE